MKDTSTNNGGHEGDPVDLRATAYALEELEPEERARFERERALDPELAAEARATAELALRLRGALAEEAGLRLDEARRTTVLNAARGPVIRSGWSFGARVAAAAALFLVLGATVWVALEAALSPGAARSLSPFTYSVGADSRSFPAELRGLGYIGDTEGSASLGYGGAPGGAFNPVESPELEALGYGGIDEPTPNTEAYDPIRENGFQDPAVEPLSTFSIDVDRASYANVRRFLNAGRLPPSDAVRIEELVNYFDYAYPAPTGDAPFSVSVDAASAPWAPEHRLVRIGLLGRLPDRDQPRTKNLVFLVDVSGSMKAAEKLPLVQRSLRLLVDELAPADRVALVVYAGSTGLVLDSTPVAQRGRILAAIEGLEAGGSTNGGAGIQLAYATARKHLDPEGVNRVVLATDGDFNVGVTDRGDLLRLIAREAESGVFLSVLGFGTGNLKDGTMEQLADRGNGNYAYVDTLAEARKVLVRELDGTLETIAKDVKIQVEFNPERVARYRLIGYENRRLAARDFDDDKKDAGEIGAGHTVTALYEVVPVGVERATERPLRYQERAPRPAALSRELLTVHLRFKQPAAATSELLSAPFTDAGGSFEAAEDDFRFATAVAAFGLCLRESEHRGSATLSDVYRWAKDAQGADPHGDRREFLKLVDVARGLER